MTASLHPPLQNGLLVVTLSVFTSSTTLICCALPALLVAMGAGATLAGIVSAVPGLVWLSAHKQWVFVVAGVVLAIAGVLREQASRVPCPVDGTLRQSCIRIRRASAVIYGVSIAVFGVGALFALVLPLLG